jgi:hypothetical protein
MDINDQQVITILREALTCYLSILGRVKSLREARLPSQGKAVETKTDLSIEQDYQQRIVATELCLRYTSDIAVTIIPSLP